MSRRPYPTDRPRFDPEGEADIDTELWKFVINFGGHDIYVWQGNPDAGPNYLIQFGPEFDDCLSYRYHIVNTMEAIPKARGLAKSRTFAESILALTSP
jgi:hypothetical protein